MGKLFLKAQLKFLGLRQIKNRFRQRFFSELFWLAIYLERWLGWIKRRIWNRGLALILFPNSKFVDHEAIMDMNDKKTQRYFSKIYRNRGFPTVK